MAATNLSWTKTTSDAGNPAWAAAGERGRYEIDMPKTKTRFTLTLNGKPVGKVDTAGKLKAMADTYDAEFLAESDAEAASVQAAEVAAQAAEPTPEATPAPAIDYAADEALAAEMDAKATELPSMDDGTEAEWAARCNAEIDGPASGTGAETAQAAAIPPIPATPGPDAVPVPKPARKVKAAATPAAAKKRDPRLPAPGTVLSKRYAGRYIDVLVGENDFTFDGQSYTSLSAVACKVINGHINGFKFFGLLGTTPPKPGDKGTLNPDGTRVEQPPAAG